MPDSEGNEDHVTGGGSAEQRKRPGRQEIEHVLAHLEAEMVRLVEELKIIRKMLREIEG